MSNPETYTDAILRIIGGRAAGTMLAVSSAEQTAASLMAKSFISADLSGAHAHLFTAERLSTMANELVINGQTIWRRMNGDIKWVQMVNISSRGNYTISGRSVQRDRIFHPRLNVDMLEGQGRSDLEIAVATRDFIRSLEYNLADEAQDPSGYVIPTQSWQNKEIREVIIELDGAKALVPPENTNFMGAPATTAAQYDWMQRRIGFNAPSEVREWYETARITAFGVLGVPPSLYSKDADASSTREAWRLYIFTVVDPMAKILEQAAERAGLEVDLNFDRLMASDIANRARAYGILVGANMPEDEAAKKTGLG